MDRKELARRVENAQISGIPEAANSEEDDNSEKQYDTERTDKTG